MEPSRPFYNGEPTLRFVTTSVLRIAYYEIGTDAGWPVVLSHGFPYDVHAYEQVVARLVSKDARVIVPYLRGFGPTHFLSPNRLRSGQQAALGDDLIGLLDQLSIEHAVLAGFDWGGRASCVAAVLQPHRVTALVSANGYNIQDIARSPEVASPEQERSNWYMWYFCTERGRSGLRENRHGITKLLWREWSPTWAWDDDTFLRSAVAFDNRDFVDVVTHSYKHRFGLAPGDPAHNAAEVRLAQQPTLSVPTITIHGLRDGVELADDTDSKSFSSHLEHRTLDNIGHNIPQEAPETWAEAVLDVHIHTSSRPR